MVKNICILGQGYVGLPLSLAAAESGYFVTGIDLDSEKVRKLNNFESTIEEISDLRIKEAINSGHYKIQDQVVFDKETEVILVCVPTPLNNERDPDLEILKNAVIAIGSNLRPGMLVIIESTIQPGVTRNVVLPALMAASNLKNEEFLLAFSPERIDPMNTNWNVKNTPKLVAGLTTEAATKAKEFYSKFIDQVDICDSLEVVETAKLLENSFRLVNISFINEVAMFCQKIGIDINDVIKAASTKPYGFMPFYPSVGVGGHCIPVDPLYLVGAANKVSAPTRFIQLADKVNLGMPLYFVDRASNILGGLRDKKILVIGVAYKPNVADVRETSVQALILGLREQGAKVSWHDNLVQSWNGEKSVDLSDSYDLAILATPHSYLNLKQLGKLRVLNTRSSI